MHTAPTRPCWLAEEGGRSSWNQQVGSVRSQALRGVESTHTTVPEAEATLGPLGILGDVEADGGGV